MTQKRGQWVSNIGFILAAAGSAVGLGNIWKFPGKLGANGGGNFILAYIIGVAVIGFTVMMAEFVIGRATQKNSVGAFRILNKRWTFIGAIGMITAFVIMSYYSVVGGWVMKYILVYLTGAEFGVSASKYQDFFINFISRPIEPLIWYAIFMAICIFVIIKGVSAGIERVSKMLMPALFILLIVVAIRSVTLDGAAEGLKFMLTLNPLSFSSGTIVAAIGQAFFSLSLGMGIMITYGSYVPKSDNLIKSATWICALDTLVAILAAFAIIPAVFVTLGHDGLGMGGGFAFMALPNVFSQMPGGNFFGLLFFILLFFAALTSAISIFEGTVAFVTEEFNMSRLPATIILAIFMTFLAVGYSLSQGAMKINLPWFDFANGLRLLPMNAVMEKFTDNLTMPLCALLFCIFVGWVWGVDEGVAEIEQNGSFNFFFKKLWKFSIRFLAPAAIIVILYHTLFLGIGLS